MCVPLVAAVVACCHCCCRCRRCLLPNVTIVAVIALQIAAAVAARCGLANFTLLLLSSNQSADLLKIIFGDKFLCICVARH
jgi:hypothetical protein